MKDFRPENAAVALNENCLRCQTFAYARQTVLNPGRPVKIGDAAQAKINAIDKRMRQLAASSEPFDKLAAGLDGLTLDLVGVIQGEVRRAGTTAVEDDHRALRVDER